MATLGTNVNTTTNTGYRPTVVSEFVIRARTGEFVMKDLVLNRSQDVLDYGQAITINTSTVSVAQDKTINTEITVGAPTETTKTITINKYKVAAEVVEDAINAQSKINLFKEKRWAIGRGLAQVIDADILALVANLSDNAAEGTGASGAQLGKTAILNAIRKLDDNNVPQDNRHYVMTPNQKNGLLGNSDFTLASSINFLKSDSPLVSGEFSIPIFGLRLHSTTNIYTALGVKYNCIFQKECLAVAMQIDPKYKENYLPTYGGTLCAAWALYGVGEIRDNHGVRMLE